MKRCARIAALILVAGASLVLAGCAGLTDLLWPAKDKSIAQTKVGATLPGGAMRWQLEAEAMQAAASGAKVDLTIDHTAASSSDQIDYFKTLVSGGNKVVFVTAIDNSDADWPAALAVAKAAGVKVVAYDRGLVGVDLYYSFDNSEIGRLQGSYLVGKVPSGAYYLLRGASTDANSALFADAAIAIIQAASPAITILNPLAIDQTVADWNPSNAQSMVSTLLGSQVPAAILAPNDGTAGGVAAAIAASSIPDASKASLLGALTGQDGWLDALKRIYNRQQGMTIVKNGVHLAKYSMTLAAKLGNGASVMSVATEKFGEPPSFLVTLAIDPDAIFVVDGANLKAKADAGLLGYTWTEIVGAQAVVQGDQAWQASEVSLAKDQTFTIVASAGPEGGVNVANTNANPYYNAHYGPAGLPNGETPDAYDAANAASYPMPSVADGALVGRVGSGSVFLVGAGGTFTSDSDGLLYLMVNDYPLTNNDGTLVVEIAK